MIRPAKHCKSESHTHNTNNKVQHSLVLHMLQHKELDDTAPTTIYDSDSLILQVKWQKNLTRRTLWTRESPEDKIPVPSIIVVLKLDPTKLSRWQERNHCPVDDMELVSMTHSALLIVPFSD